MNCFFCTSPYQILASASIVFRDEIEADLFIVDQFAGFDDIGERVKQTGIFNNVYLVKEKDIVKSLKSGSGAFLTHLKLFSLYSKGELIASLISDSPEIYKNIYVSSKAIVPRIFSLYCKKEYGAHIHYYDDGTGSYNNNAYDTRLIEKFVRGLFYGKNSIGSEESLNLYLPELYEILNPNSKSHTKKIPSIANHKLFEAIYDMSKVEYIKEKIIFFDTVYSEVYGSNIDGYKNVVEYLISHCGNEVIVKPHPREKRRIFTCNYYNGPNYPFECNCAKQDMEGKVIISALSTSCMVPKMLFNQEPYVIFVHDLVAKYMLKKLTFDETFFEAFRDTYTNKNRVFIPKDMEELKDILSLLQNDEGK